MGPDDPAVLYEVRGPVARLTLNRPARRNALDRPTLDLLRAGLDRAEADGVRVVCLTGAGDRVFCAGADLGDPAGFARGPDREGPRAFAALLKRLWSYPLPLVARLNGHCLGGGVGLALACDLAVARDDIEVGTPEVRVGLFPMMIAPLILRKASRAKAVEMILTGGRVPAREAEAMGLVTRAVPAAELDAVVERAVAGLVAAAPLALRLGREALREVEGMPVEAAVDLLCDRLVALLATEDAAEGMRAFLERRAPQWRER